MIEVIEAGPSTTVQDRPGRLGYWDVGVPPSGPMDDLSHELANRVVGNAPAAAALELTRWGPTLRFDRPAVIAVGGATMAVAIDGRPAPQWAPLTVEAGSVVAVGEVSGPGMRATLAVRGGIDVAPYLGSRSTFTLGNFGGHQGRALQGGDVLTIGDLSVAQPHHLSAGLAPELGSSWTIGVLVGPHTEPEFLEVGGLATFVRTAWVVHFNSNRTGVRLIGPRPRWARADGGEAGLHPSNVHDTGYAFGSVDLTGDMPIVLGPDGPSLGGFVCPLVVAVAERWKLGQLAPGDVVRFQIWSAHQAAGADEARRGWTARATTPVEPLARPRWNGGSSGRNGGSSARNGASPQSPGGAGSIPVDTSLNEAVLARRAASGVEGEPAVTYRRAGDRFLLVEYGDMTLDLALRLRVQALDRWRREHLVDGVVDATPGVRSLLVQVDGDRLTVEGALQALYRAETELADVVDEGFPSRIVHLPLSWDDPATREAISRYMHGVRDDAPWCPWNIEFIRRVNGLDSVDDVHRIVFDATYLVLGLGDVYLGAPLATPVDPRHRLVTTKYNPARTWTPENAVGIGGAYLCIYGMEGPGGYQFVGRTVQVWSSQQRGPHFAEPWLLRHFDQIRWHPVGADELLDMRSAQSVGELALGIEDTTFRLADQQRALAGATDSIAAFQTRQRQAFDAERTAWAEAGEFERTG